jgi:hypothetical protein
MPLWKLAPIDLTHRNWTASTHRGEAIVRAASEKVARDLAVAAFAIAVPRVPGADIVHTPWRHADLVSCRQIEDPRFPEDGPDGVLDPEHYD